MKQRIIVGGAGMGYTGKSLRGTGVKGSANSQQRKKSKNEL